MSWMKSMSGEVFNLDDVRKFELGPLGEDPDRDPEITHGLFAYGMQDGDDDQPSYAICTGTEAECEALLERIISKLPMVKL